MFVDQLEAELEQFVFEKVEGNRLCEDGKDIMGSPTTDFRKRFSGRGYQPMV